MNQQATLPAKARSAIAVTSATALNVAGALTADAGVSKSGTQYCGPTEQARVKALAYGNLDLKGPGEGSGVYTRYWLGYSYKNAYRGGPGGYWRAVIPGELYGGIDNQGTYSYCLYR